MSPSPSLPHSTSLPNSTSTSSSSSSIYSQTLDNPTTTTTTTTTTAAAATAATTTKAETSHPLHLRFIQAFGADPPPSKDPAFQDESDNVTAVSIRSDGKEIAVGDASGRVLILGKDRKDEEWRVRGQWIGSENGWDCVKGMEVGAGICGVDWVGEGTVVVAGERDVRVWRVGERGFGKVLKGGGFGKDKVGGKRILRLPVIEKRERKLVARPRISYPNLHQNCIQSLAMCSDGECFMTADPWKICLWNLGNGGVKGLEILDIDEEMPGNASGSENITGVEFHPRQGQIFVRSSTKGILRLCDLRASPKCTSHVKRFYDIFDSFSRHSFFSAVISSISDVKFSPDGRYLLTRDYMKLKLWDLHMDRAPILNIPVHEHLRSHLVELYENESIFDQFECGFSHDGGSIVTGSYDSMLNTYNLSDGEGAAVKLTVDFVGGVEEERQKNNKEEHRAEPESDILAEFGEFVSNEGGWDYVDPTKKIRVLDTDANSNLTAAAAGGALYLWDT